MDIHFRSRQASSMVSANSFLSLMLRGFRASASVNSSVRQSSRGSSSRFAALSWSGGGVRAGKLALCTALLAAAAGAQSPANWRIDTFAGLPDVRDNGPATDARLDYPNGVATDGTGNLYFADQGNHRIRKVDAAGVITTIAGTGEQGFGGDGSPAVDAQLNTPLGVAADSAGNVYFADLYNQRIRMVDSSGVITTIAGTGERGFGGDGGPAVDAQLNAPVGVATDGAGNLFIAERSNNRIRKVDSSGVITTIAGTGERGFGGDGGPAVDAQLNTPLGVAADNVGNLYIADERNQRIRKVDSSGVITTIAGTGEVTFGGDGGPATEAQLHNPTDVAADGAGNLFIADRLNNRIRKVDSSGTITTVAGGGGALRDGGPAVQAQLRGLNGVATDATGNLYITDSSNHRIRKVDSAGTITKFAGGGEITFSGDGSPALQAQLRSPNGAAADGAGNLFIADQGNHRIRMVDSTGVITTVAGSGERGFGGDGGPATEAQLFGPIGLTLDGAGNLLIVDTFNHRIRMVDSAGTITTIAGTGERGFGGDGGPATQAQLYYPYSVATDGTGNLFIADRSNHRIRMVDSAGTITTIAGTGERGFSGDGGPATQAKLASPYGVATDGTGNLLIVDTFNHRIRKVDSAGTITTIAGTGERGFGGDGGPATQAQLYYPYSVATDGTGNLFIADRSNHRIRMVDSAGTITTIAGTGEQGFGGDGGPATQAKLASPYGVATDGTGNLFIADAGNHRIRILTPATGPTLAAVLNAAAFTPGVAPGSIAILFGKRLALETVSASAQQLLAALGGVRIEVIDGTGAARAARLLFVSTEQINFLMPDEAAPGATLLRLTREGEEPAELAFTTGVVAPGLFSANGTGEGIGAISALRVGADGSRSHPAVFRSDAAAGRMTGVPLNLGAEGDRVFLALFGTGIRGAGQAFEAVRATIGDSEAPLLYAGAQGGVAGLDQVNVGPLPRSLAGAGEVNVVVSAAGISSNTVTIVIE